MTKLKSAIIFLCLAGILSSCKLGRFVWYNTADVDDHKHFKQSAIEKGEANFEFVNALGKRQYDSLTINHKGKSQKVNFNQFLKKAGTLAFVIIRNDSLLFESYYNGHTAGSISVSFSVTKSILSMMLGCALEDGIIESIEDPITKYLPELSKNGFDQVRLEHLLQMTSGIKFWENYWMPYSHAGNFYYGTDMYKDILKLKLKHTPGKHYDYRSGDSQLLGFVLSKALGEETLSAYLERKIWKRLGMSGKATWLLDDVGMERAFAGISARAMDFARIGRLALLEGDWEGETVVPKAWMKKCFEIKAVGANPTEEGAVYQFKWRLKEGGKQGIYALGYKGQLIYLHRESKTIMVRLGGKEGGVDWDELMYEIAQM